MVLLPSVQMADFSELHQNKERSLFSNETDNLNKLEISRIYNWHNS